MARKLTACIVSTINPAMRISFGHLRRHMLF
jgi:hypothetical protein